MSIKDKFPNVHWIWSGGISFVYEVHPRIVVKVPQFGEFEQEQFRNELKIWNVLLQQPPCPSDGEVLLSSKRRHLPGVHARYVTPTHQKFLHPLSFDAKVILLEDGPLASRIQHNHISELEIPHFVTEVKKLEPLSLRKEWMHDLARAIAFLESLNLAHDNLRPENILLDRDRLKLSDFDCAAEMGAYSEVCSAPYGRLLNANETHLEAAGTVGPLSSTTEQFALGSLFYFINYGFEVYADRRLTEDHREQWSAVVILMQNMEFPLLDGNDELINQTIDKYWHNKYATIADLVRELKEKLPLSANPIHKDQSIETKAKHDGQPPERPTDLEQDCVLADPDAKKTFCQDLISRGLLDKLPFIQRAGENWFQSRVVQT